MPNRGRDCHGGARALPCNTHADERTPTVGVSKAPTMGDGIQRWEGTASPVAHRRRRAWERVVEGAGATLERSANTQQYFRIHRLLVLNPGLSSGRPTSARVLGSGLTTLDAGRSPREGGGSRGWKGGHVNQHRKEEPSAPSSPTGVIIRSQEDNLMSPLPYRGTCPLQAHVPDRNTSPAGRSERPNRRTPKKRRNINVVGLPMSQIQIHPPS